MVVDKIINNNIVSAFDENGTEVVVMGRGLGFGKKPGSEVPEEQIEKVFRIKSQSLAEQFKELLATMPLEHAQISNDIISYAKNTLNLKLNQRVYRKELLPDEEEELAYMMRNKYPVEYQCSRKIVRYIEQETKSKISGEEIMYLAIHIRRVTMAEEQE